MKDILAVIGAQYGSEGKGNIVAHVAKDYDTHVRVGGPNAGHSFYRKGRLWKMQTIPCGWVNPLATLILGRGALISVEQLAKEWADIVSVDSSITERLKIDRLAGIVLEDHRREAGGVHGEAHKRYGSTGEGVGVARIARIERRLERFYRAGDLPLNLVPPQFRSVWPRLLVDNTPDIIQNSDGNVLLEGTQGSALSLIHGPWPYVTNHDTNAAQLAADCGLPPRLVNRCLLVMRTLPIRVAGNSGPMAEELTWEDVSARVGRPVTEQTTVTKKTRRVAEWDEALIEQAVLLNAPTSVAINFLDYIAPEDEGKTAASDLSRKSWSFIEYVRQVWSVPVCMVGTGGPECAVAWVYQTNDTSWRL